MNCSDVSSKLKYLQVSTLIIDLNDEIELAFDKEFFIVIVVIGEDLFMVHPLVTPKGDLWLVN